MLLKLLRTFALLVMVSGIIYFFLPDHMKEKLFDTPERVKGVVHPVGTEIATYKKVSAYQNGTVVTRSHGKHYADDGYYYGQKWQCVEYIKRFYHDAKNHDMPSVWGNARDFFDPAVHHGQLNPNRGLVQFRNGGNTPPKPDDLLVFRDGSLGHVAIITKVNSDSIEVIQQNVLGSPTSSHQLKKQNGNYTVGTKKQPTGWLRLP
ncbi:MAG: surface antigen [Akkermansiaceae bacterium]|jgi:surface antigen